MQEKNKSASRGFKIGSKILWMMLSLVLAFFIWTYYSMNYATEITRTFYGVEVTYSGDTALRDSLSLIVSNEEVTSVNVTLTGSRRDLARLTSADLKAVVNLSNVTSAGYRTMSYTISYPNSVYGSSIQVQSQSPQTVGLQISKLATRTVNVAGSFIGTVAEGYVVDTMNITYSPAVITLVGPEEELNEVYYAQVLVDRDNVTSAFTASANYVLVDTEGNELVFSDVTADADTVTVSVPVNLTKEVALDVAILDGGGATADNVIKTITPSSITLAGDAATLEGINTIYLATVDLSDYQTFPQTEYAIVLPNDTQNLSGVTSAVVDISFTGLESKLFTVSNLEYTNLAAGYSASIMDNTLVVTIRGTAEQLAAVEENNIRAVADLTDITATSRVPVTIYVDGSTDVGAVGDYFMYVRVSAGGENG